MQRQQKKKKKKKIKDRTEERVRKPGIRIQSNSAEEPEQSNGIH